MMGKRLVLERYGQTREDAIDNILRLEDLPMPAASSLGPSEVLVAVKSAAVSAAPTTRTAADQYHADEGPSCDVGSQRHPHHSGFEHSSAAPANCAALSGGGTHQSVRVPSVSDLGLPLRDVLRRLR